MVNFGVNFDGPSVQQTAPSTTGVNKMNTSNTIIPAGQKFTGVQQSNPGTLQPNK